MKLSSLFWKLFFYFWAANVFITLLTSHIVLSINESRNFRERHETMLRYLSHEIINQVENNKKIRPKKLKKYLRNRQADLPPMRIYKGDELIFSYKAKNPYWVKQAMRPKSIFRMQIQTNAGAQYALESIKKPPSKLIHNAFKNFKLLHIVFALFASALLSFVLTHSLIRPIKSLGRYSRKFAEHDDKDIDPSLLDRKDEIGGLARDIQYMTAEVKKHEHAQTQLMHDISHELRAPLARLQIAAAILEQEHPPSKEIDRIHKESEHISGLIQKILDYSRLENTRSSRTKCDIEKTLTALIEDLNFLYPDRTFTIKNSAKNVTKEIYPELLICALENILLNACKYTPTDTPIDIGLSETNNELAIEIRDYGEGIAEEDLPNLTNAFYRGDASTGKDGFGLGLSIAARAIEKHNGKLEIKNHDGPGLLVVLMLI